MKPIKIVKISVFFCSILFFIGCKTNKNIVDGTNINNEKDESGIMIKKKEININYTLLLNIHLYPMQGNYQYSCDDNEVSVKYINKKESKDSTIFKTKKKYDPSHIFDLVRSLKNDSYENKCIEDGQIFTLVLLANDSIFRKVKFCNVYNDSLNDVIKFLNLNVDKEYEINYDKDKLIQYMQDCE